MFLQDWCFSCKSCHFRTTGSNCCPQKINRIFLSKEHLRHFLFLITPFFKQCSSSSCLKWCLWDHHGQRNALRNAPSFSLDSYLKLFLCRVKSSENGRETLIHTSMPCLAYSLEIDSLLPQWYVYSSLSTCMYSQKCRNFGLFSFFIICLYWGATSSLSFSLLF